MRRWVLIPAFAALLLAVAGCGDDGDSDATPAPSPGGEEGPVVVTIRVGNQETYRVRLVEEQDIEIARQLLAGERAPSIPNGVVVRGATGVNEGWSWHIDPESFEWADMTIEVCDGLPSGVEDGTITSERFCPWTAEVVDIQPLER